MASSARYASTSTIGAAKIAHHDEWLPVTMKAINAATTAVATAITVRSQW